MRTPTLSGRSHQHARANPVRRLRANSIATYEIIHPPPIGVNTDRPLIILSQTRPFRKQIRHEGQRIRYSGFR